MSFWWGGKKTITSPRSGRADVHDFCPRDRQTQPVGKLVHQDIVAHLQRRHHRRRGNLKGLVEERTKHQHKGQHRKKRPGVLYDRRLRCFTMTGISKSFRCARVTLLPSGKLGRQLGACPPCLSLEAGYPRAISRRCRARRSPKVAENRHSLLFFYLPSPTAKRESPVGHHHNTFFQTLMIHTEGAERFSRQPAIPPKKPTAESQRCRPASSVSYRLSVFPAVSSFESRHRHNTWR